MRLSTKIAYNTIIQIISKTVATVLGLVSVAIMTRYLGKIGFGEYTTIMTFLSFFGIVADLGLTLVTVQMISRPGVNENKIINNLFTLRFFSALIFLSLAPLTVLFFPYSPLIKIGIALTTFSFLFTALNQILVGIFQKNLRMDKVSIAEVVSRIFLIVFIILAARSNFGLVGMLLATIISGAISFILHFYYARRYVKIKFEFDKIIWKEILLKSWPLAITIFFNLIYLKADILILSIIKSQAEVGVYGAAYKVIDVLATLPFMFAGIILPILTFSWEGADKARFKSVLQKSFDFMIILAVPMVVGTQFLGDRIMTLVAGEEFSDSGPILRILILAAGIIFLSCILSHAIIAMDKQKKLIGIYIFTSLTSLLGYFIFIPKYSYFGAAWVTIYSEAVIFSAVVYYVWKHSSFLPNFMIGLKSVAASLLMLFVLKISPSFLFTGYNFIILILLSAAVYFASLYLLKGISKKDIIDLLNK